MKWKHPPIIKIYEAIGAIVDGRIVMNGNAAKVYSSSGNKYYDVSYDEDSNSIMTNDNGSYWKGYLGYPAIAYLIKCGVLPFEERVSNLLKGIAWKNINQNFKNDFDKTLNFILSELHEPELGALKNYVDMLNNKIKQLGLNYFGKKVKPPEGY